MMPRVLKEAKTVRRLVSIGLVVTFFWVLGSARNLKAQDLVITNARIIAGTGTVINNGSIVIGNGRLASLSAGGAANVAGVKTIDAHGMTAVPGFIDGHRHINTGPNEK